MERCTHFPDDPTYPPALRDLVARKVAGRRALRTLGPWPAPEGVAIVGARDPSEEAARFTRSLAAAIVASGWAVWSGGARGIDAAAHEGAMDGGGVTVVVSPSGLDAPYPGEHRDLFARVVAKGGTLVSPFEDDVGPTLRSFHLRNAVLAALTFATIVVQAGEKSGSAIDREARAGALGRPLFVVPHPPWEERGRGCAIELALGARAIVSEEALVASLVAEQKKRRGRDVDPRDVVASRAHERAEVLASRAHERAEVLARDHTHARTLQDLDEETTRVLDAISEVPIHMDDLCERAALRVGTVAAALLTLTLGAVVVEAPAGYYRRLPSI